MQLATYPAGRAVSEARTAVSDGFIWPIVRDRMVDDAAITERMVEDIGGLVHDGGGDAVVCLNDLDRLGWLPEQRRRCGARAFALFEAAHRPARRRTTGNRSTVRGHDYRREVACLALLAIPAGIWARALLAGLV